MTELQLYKFISDNKLEVEWRDDALILWINFYSLNEFTQLVNDYIEHVDSDEVARISKCIALDIVPICEFYDIEPKNIHPMYK